MFDNIFSNKHIILDSKASSKQEVFEELAKLSVDLKIVDDQDQLIKGFWDREKESSTQLDTGFAIPHCKADFVKSPAVILLRLKNEILWDEGVETSKVKALFALVVPNANASSLHLDLLSQVAKSLLNDDVKNTILTAKSKNKIVEALDEFNKQQEAKKEAKDTDANENKGLILAVTGCPVGIAHTFMAAENVEKAGTEMGYKMKVETHGADGVKNEFNYEEINKAEMIIIASDIDIPLDRFPNKRIFISSVGKAIKKPKELITEAFEKGKILKNKDSSDIFTVDDNKQKKGGLMKHLMLGVSYMVPIVIVGGLFLAFSIGLGKAIYGYNYDPSKDPGNALFYINAIGGGAFMLMIPILGAYIAFSIAGKAAFAPALILSYIANTNADFFPYPGFNIQTPTGFLGAIAVGLAVGYTVKWALTINVPKTIKPVMPLIAIPVLVTLVYGVLIIFAFGSAIGWLMQQVEYFIKQNWNGQTSSWQDVLTGLGFGILLGAMIGFDMGGPVNKIAFTTGVALLTAGIRTPMGAAACAIPVAPLGMGLSTIIFRKYYDEDTRNLGVTALILSLFGISEGAIPFAIKDPKRVIPCNILGSAVAGGLGGVIGITDWAGHGGPIIGIVGALGHGNDVGWNQTGWYWILLALAIMFAGALVTAFSYGFLTMLSRRENKKVQAQEQPTTLKTI